jgi:hypothetical protein
MVKNSTLFFIYDNLNKENELYQTQDLLDEGEIDEEIDFLLSRVEFSPSDSVLKEIFEKAF